MNLGEIQLDFNYYKRNSLNIRFFSKYLINAKCKNILIIPQNQIKKVYPNPSHEGVNSRITFGCWHPRKNKQPVKACDHTEVEGSFSYCRKTSPLLPFSALSVRRGG